MMVANATKLFMFVMTTLSTRSLLFLIGTSESVDPTALSNFHLLLTKQQQLPSMAKRNKGKKNRWIYSIPL